MANTSPEPGEGHHPVCTGQVRSNAAKEDGGYPRRSPLGWLVVRQGQGPLGERFFLACRDLWGCLAAGDFTSPKSGSIQCLHIALRGCRHWRKQEKEGRAKIAPPPPLLARLCWSLARGYVQVPAWRSVWARDAASKSRFSRNTNRLNTR
jgi:hypothetical protein